MEETLLLPSPNWFQASGLSVSGDGWLVYGGPSKSLCILEPLPQNVNGLIQGDRYRAHVLNRAHGEKIVSVDISPEWPEKKAVLSGSTDGSVKQWIIEVDSNKYKIKSTHSHDIHYNDKEEVTGIGYSSGVYAVTVGCFGNIVKWNLNSNVVKTYNNFLKNFKPTCMSCSQHITLHLAVGTKQGVIFVLDLNGTGKILYKVRGQDDEIVNASWCPQYNVAVKKYLKESEKRISANERMNKIRQEPEDTAQNLDQSAVSKKLPDDSFDESVVVQEDDLFDMYKDDETDEFGPKKYEPEVILVKVKEEVETDVSYLDECMKLKEEILKRKSEPEPSMASLVEALEKTHVENEHKEHEEEEETCTSEEKSEASIHTHKHLLATVGKQGGVRIWSKTGKLVASCAVPNAGNKNQRSKLPNFTTLLWYRADTLLIADGKSQLLQCDPLKVDCKNKLEFQVVHSIHKRGLFSIVTDAPKIQTIEEIDAAKANQWSIWTAAQDRNLVRYSLERKQKLSILATCGGFLYNIQPCPYDARKVAVSVGDGAVRVWEADIADDDDTKLCLGNVSTYWQNVQGKVLSIAWHPTKENLLAFGTAESRVGLIDTNGKTERAARTLVPALTGGVYSLCWGKGEQLFACANGKFAVYDTKRPDQPPEMIKVCMEGQQWEVSCVQCLVDSLVIGTNNGAVAVLEQHPSYSVLAVNYAYTKMIYNVQWHPQQTSESNDKSQYKNLVAVTSLDKQNTITILEYGVKEDGTKQLQLWKTLSGHKSSIYQVAWNPHRDELILSTSHDSTARVWDVAQGVCVSIFSGHAPSALSCAWSAWPQLHALALTGGADCALRLWRAPHHPAAAHADTVQHCGIKKDKRKHYKEKKEEKKAEEDKNEVEGQAHLASVDKIKSSKKYLLPIIHKQIVSCHLQGARKMLQNYIEKNTESCNVQIETGNKGEGDFNKLTENENSSVNNKDASSSNDDVSTSNKDAATPDKEVNTSEKDATAEVKNASSQNKAFGTDFVKMFGSTNEINEVLDMEMEQHLSASNVEAWIMLSILRGHIDAMIQFASQRDLLCPYLISISPCVSFKYWKDATQLYLAQLDRLVAKGEEDKLLQFKNYGGVVYRKVGLLLSMHDVKGAVATLIESRLYKEAYILCRTRHMDSIASETLHKWAKDCYYTGSWTMAAICYIALGDLSQAATILGKSNDQECLCLAADIAKVAGYNTFADHIEERKLQIKSKETKTETDKSLADLPSRMELLMKSGMGGDTPTLNVTGSEINE
ncbi:unnamed protein product [Parnassius mnemosyne]|uniref:Gem-associated protein 5 n=1 Tax=Parnassius mnemosyne TaxID=213953 RepID=A0AAV1K525_9NEOP